MSQLRAAVADLRTNENAYETDAAAKEAEMRAVSDESQLQTKDSFTYGSTPYTSWLELWQHKVLQEATRRARVENREILVLGSSIGWIPLYSALTYQVRTRGVEILPFRVEVSRGVIESHLDAETRGLISYQAEVRMPQIQDLKLTSP